MSGGRGGRTRFRTQHEIDGGDGYTVYGQLVDADTAAAERAIPLEVLDEASVTGDVTRDEYVTYDDVEVDKDSFIHKLQQLQKKNLWAKV
ncbi:hypothetical protein [Halarchaeum salinum]|uniref:Uncharacterized protein n=1 Tax=Halarchaeum salinum TaxID=489912 RepID=A0AAV3S996_9EURY